MFGWDFSYSARIESVVNLLFVAAADWLKKLSSSDERFIVDSSDCCVCGDVVADDIDALKKLLNGSVESEPDDVNDVSINVGFESFVGVSN